MKYFTVLLYFGFIISCKQKVQPETPDKLYEKYRKSVVIIRSQYYYEVEFSNGKNAYFNSIENGEISDLTPDEDEAIKNASTIYGTGFFISKDGKISN